MLAESRCVWWLVGQSLIANYLMEPMEPMSAPNLPALIYKSGSRTVRLCSPHPSGLSRRPVWRAVRLHRRTSLATSEQLVVVSDQFVGFKLYECLGGVECSGP
jgi:hypothetical protein